MEVAEVIPAYIKFLAYLFVFVYMLSVGLEISPGEIRSLLKDSKFIFIALSESHSSSRRMSGSVAIHWV